MRLKTLYPEGACSGTTKLGARCQIRDVFENGLCKHHGGKGTLLRVIYQREKLMKKADRLKKKYAKQHAAQKIIEELKARNPNLQAAIDRILARHGRQSA